MPENNTLVTFKIHYKCDFGQSVFVLITKPEEKEQWCLQNAVRLDWSEGDSWSKKIEFETQESSLSFNYKYIVADTESPLGGSVLWEKGLKRCFRADNSGKKSFQIEDRWNHQRIKIYIKDVLKSQERNKKGLGLMGPKLFGESHCIEMYLTCNQESGIRHWESNTFWIPLSLEQVSFSVYFVDLKRRNIIDNRRIDCSYLINPQKAVEHLQKGIKLRGNQLCFVERPEYKNFIFSEINERLVLGACINDNAERNLLATADVKAILNLETQSDASRQKRQQIKNNDGIPEFRFPIEDNLQDLSSKIIKGAKFLKTLVDTQKRVYVHCTYGVFRSVHVVIAYLYLYEGMDILQAIEKVQGNRSQARPREDLCMKLLQDSNHAQGVKSRTQSIQKIFFKKRLESKRKMSA